MHLTQCSQKYILESSLNFLMTITLREVVLSTHIILLGSDELRQTGVTAIMAHSTKNGGLGWKDMEKYE